MFKQQLAPWSVTSEVSTPDPSFRVEFLRSKQHNYLWKTQLQRAQEKKCRIWSCCRWYSAQITHKIQGTVESSFYMLGSTHRLFRNAHDVRLHTSRIGHHNVPSSIFTWYVLKIVTLVIMQSKSRCFSTFDGGDVVSSMKSHLSPSVSRAGRDDFGHPPSEDTLSRRWSIQSCLLFSTLLGTMKPNLQCPLIDTVRTAFNATKHTAFRYLFIVVLCEALETQYWPRSQCLSAQVFCVFLKISHSVTRTIMSMCFGTAWCGTDRFGTKHEVSSLGMKNVFHVSAVVVPISR